MTEPDARPLDGFRIIEVGQLLAGPFVGCILGYFGAEVIKVEAPGDGDPIRKWRILDDHGTSWWWRSLGRNKKCITANLRRAATDRQSRCRRREFHARQDGKMGTRPGGFQRQ